MYATKNIGAWGWGHHECVCEKRLDVWEEPEGEIVEPIERSVNSVLLSIREAVWITSKCLPNSKIL